VAAQLDRLVLLGTKAEGLFAASAKPDKRGKVVVADGDSMLFFDDEDAALDAAAKVTVRLVGPLGCVVYARAGEPLPEVQQRDRRHTATNATAPRSV
jgi:hypothetical protein